MCGFSRLPCRGPAIPLLRDCQRSIATALMTSTPSSGTSSSSFASMSVLSNMSACQVDVFSHVEYVGGNFSATHHPCRCAYALPTCPEKSQVGGRTGNLRGSMRRLRPLLLQSCASSLGQSSLRKKMQRHRGAPEVEPSDDKCADADDIDVNTLVSVVEGT